MGFHSSIYGFSHLNNFLFEMGSSMDFSQIFPLNQYDHYGFSHEIMMDCLIYDQYDQPIFINFPYKVVPHS